ncbi:uncharacterized protein DNG_00055 [Cephalotrichum gorgonifer]|uniref:Uncharacterized protein n=1 Tax=Cephalotrichum gorgonifer TaxID=2041049 RepID=A0AAE8MN90_9PEZI|nr:uncharacterized protein DNG_00055 [Cephalotrichum gorgonifer]
MPAPSGPESEAPLPEEPGPEAGVVPAGVHAAALQRIEILSRGVQLLESALERKQSMLENLIRAQDRQAASLAAWRRSLEQRIEALEEMQRRIIHVIGEEGLQEVFDFLDARR